MGIVIFLNRFRHKIGEKPLSAFPSSANQLDELPKEVPISALSFAADIRPLFRDGDIEAMEPNGIDLSSYEDVKKRAQDIYIRLSSKEMPCDEPWSDRSLRKLREWMQGDMKP